MPDSTKQTKRKRRWLRFSLRSFLIGITFFGVVVGPYIYRVEQQRVAAKWIEENNGLVIYDFMFDASGELTANAHPFGPTWLHDILGVDYFSSVVEVDFFLWAGEDVKQLAGLKQLRRLRFWNVGIANPKPLEQVTDLTPLTGLTSLEDLDFRGTQVTDLTPVAGLASLKILYLENSQVSDLTPLSGMTELTDLFLANTYVSDTTSLSALTSLDNLNLQGTQVTDVSPLANLTNLTDLAIQNTQVNDLTPLAGLTSLEFLNLECTQVVDLTPLTGLTSLEYLHLRGTQVTDEEIKKLQTALPNCIIYH